ncbi:5-methylcytosine restriction system specificity protein McrC [Erysipelothrix anatis]|uniref:5-methylcytosine restriction system specificity protein McrC n=1 Tax=Erysipelothrix anatis TaxID=2683713 RepID=UPI001358B19F|nr:3-isopropylmalate dehydrogenase [Erysipelothrix anatis]
MRLYDNSSVATSDEFRLIYPNIHDKFVDITMQRLLSSGNVLVFPNGSVEFMPIANESKIFETRDGKIFTSNFIGYFGVKGENIILKSRFGSKDNDYFLFYLLEKVLGINFLNYSTSYGLEDTIFNFIEFIFPQYLDSAMKKGMFKKYNIFSHNDMNVKGKIDIPNFVKKNTPFNGKISYTTREFSFDNNVTQLVRHTIEVMKSKNNLLVGSLLQQRRLKENIDEVIRNTPSYSKFNRNQVISQNIMSPVNHAFFYEYRQLQKLCIMILTGRKHGIKQSDNELSGIVFDVAWLWEEYIANLLNDYFIHPENRTGLHKQFLFENEQGKRLGAIYPDLIGKNDFSKVIADVKYKPFNNISGQDYHQILSYMFRFDRKAGYFFYPQTETDRVSKLSKLSLLEGFGDSVSSNEDSTIIEKIPFMVPTLDVKKYSDFVEKMEFSEQSLIEKIVMLRNENLNQF